MTRLQFRHHIEVFESRAEAISFLDGLVNNESGSAPIGESKMGEPLLVVYQGEDRQKHAILAIGKNEGGTGIPYQYIDADFMLSRIETAESKVEDMKSDIDEAKGKIASIENQVGDLAKTAIKSIIINDLSADIQNNIAKLTLGGGDVKLTGYAKSESSDNTLRDTDSVNGAFGKLEAKADKSNERITELENVHPDEVTIIKTAKGKDNYFLSTALTIKESTDVKSANYRAVYQLVDANGNRIGNDIIIYKDSRLKNVELKKDEKGRATILEFTYVDENGEDKLIPINIADFLQEAEFKAGLTVIDGEVSVKRDPSSEDFFTISSDGLKVAGINDAISSKVKEESDRAIAKETELENALKNSGSDASKAIDAAKSELNAAIKAEEKRATDAETELGKRIDGVNDSLNAEITRATEKEKEISQLITGGNSDIKGLIEKEVTRATNAEGILDTKINTEAERVLSEAKAEAHKEFDIVNNKITEEAARATQKEGELANLINSNKTATDTAIENAIRDSKKYTDDQGNILKAQIKGATIKPIAPITANATAEGTEVGLALESKKILSTINGELSTTLGIQYNPDTWMLQLIGIDDTVISQIDARAFIKTGLISSIGVESRNDVKYLIIEYQDAEGNKSTVELAVAELFSPYIASNGIEIKEEDGKANVISVKVNPDGDGKYITLGSAGLGLSGISDTLTMLKSNINNDISTINNNVESLETRMSGDASVDGSVAHKINDAKKEILDKFISKTITDITSEAAEAQTLLKKIGTGNDAEIYASNNTADMLYRGASLESTIDSIIDRMDGLELSLSAIADRLTKLEESLKNVNVNIEGAPNEIKVTKSDSKYIIGFADNAIFGPIE